MYEKFENSNTEVYSISTDTVFVHKVWDEYELSNMVDGGIPYPMLQDPDGRIGRAYGVYDEEEMVHKRGVVIIDPDGIVQAIEVLNAPAGRNFNEVHRQLRAFQYVRENSDEVVPAGWEEGKTTLKPGKDLVGKVFENWSLDELKK